MKHAALFLFVCLAGMAQQPGEKCSIEGTVVNGLSGEAVKKAQVTVHRVGDANNFTTLVATTDGGGHFLVDGLDAGKYTVTAAKPGFVSQGFGARGPARPNTPITLGAGGKRNDLNIRMMPHGIVMGRILDEDGDPLANANVQLQQVIYVRGRKRLNPVNGGGANTNDLGEYRIFGLGPGKYYLVATYQGPEPMASANRVAVNEEEYPPIYYPNALTPESAAPLEVTPGAQLRGIDLTMTKVRAARIRGRIVDANNKPLPNAGVSLIKRDGGAFNPMNRKLPRRLPDGSFEFRNVEPGSYTLAADYLEDEMHMTGRLAVNVGSTNVDGVVLTVGMAPDLTGHVLIEGKSEIAPGSVSVFLEPKGGGVAGGAGGLTNPDGTFRLQYVMPEAYLVNVLGLRENLYLKTVKFGEADVTENGLDFSQGVTPGELTVVLKAAGGQVEGVVQDDKQQNAAGATVVLVPEGSKRSHSWLYRTATTDKNGHYTLRGVAPGEYKLFAWEQVEPDAYQDPDFLKPFESRGETVSVDENSHENKQLTIIPADESKP